MSVIQWGLLLLGIVWILVAAAKEPRVVVGPLQRVVSRKTVSRQISMEKLACGHTWAGPPRMMHGVNVGRGRRRCSDCVKKRWVLWGVSPKLAALLGGHGKHG